MKHHFILSMSATASALLLIGCSDPAKEVHKSPASEPQAAPASASAAAQDYVIRAESTIGFVGSKVTGSHSGGFKKFAGMFQVLEGKIVGTPEVKIDMTSTWSDSDRLTGHLTSPDFFNVAKYPSAMFTATLVEPDGDQHKVTGNLNLHGETKSISFPAAIQISGESVMVKAEFAINRKEFNINYPGRPNDLIRDNVVIKLDLTATPGPARPEDQLTL